MKFHRFAKYANEVRLKGWAGKVSEVSLGICKSETYMGGIL